MIILSILIATIPAREEGFRKLLNELWLQRAALNEAHPTLGDVEFKVDESKSFLNGGLSIGKKREALVKRANGKWLCFLDDDEEISPNYLETLVRLAQEDKDACTFKAIVKTDMFWGVVNMSMYCLDTEANPRAEILRNIWQVCPIRSSIAKKYPFPDSNYGEDIAWLENVRKDIKSEAHSPFILLQYNHSSRTSEADKIMKHVQSKQ